MAFDFGAVGESLIARLGGDGEDLSHVAGHLLALVGALGKLQALHRREAGLGDKRHVLRRQCGEGRGAPVLRLPEDEADGGEYGDGDDDDRLRRRAHTVRHFLLRLRLIQLSARRPRRLRRDGARFLSAPLLLRLRGDGSAAARADGRVIKHLCSAFFTSNHSVLPLYQPV